MALSENATRMIPQPASRIIARALDDARIPTIDVDPQRAETVAQRAEAIIEDLLRRPKGPNDVRPYGTLSGELREAAELERSPEVGQVLNSIAQSVGMLANQPEGSRYEPRAFEPLDESAA